MSISGINSSTASSIYSEIASQKTSSTDASKMTEQIGEILENTEIDQETQEAILADLKTAIEKLMADSNGEKLDSKTMYETINKVFSKHGLDIEKIVNERLSKDSLFSKGSSLIDSIKSNQKSLIDYIGNNNGKIDCSLLDECAERMSQRISQSIMDFLVGINKVA